MSDIENSRTAFEEFFRESRGGKGKRHAERTLIRMEDGSYLNPSTQRHWWTWQRAQAALIARAEAAERGLRRYEHLRTLNAQQFADLFVRNIKGEGAFDDLVDAAVEDAGKTEVAP